MQHIHIFISASHSHPDTYDDECSVVTTPMKRENSPISDSPPLAVYISKLNEHFFVYFHFLSFHDAQLSVYVSSQIHQFMRFSIALSRQRQSRETMVISAAWMFVVGLKITAETKKKSEIQSSDINEQIAFSICVEGSGFESNLP